MSLSIKVQPAQLVTHHDQKITTTSLIIAEAFGKHHKDVLRAIQNIDCSEEFRSAQFCAYPYQHPQNKQTYNAYEITKDGFMFLVMGFTGKKAAAWKETFINAFNQMAEQLANPQKPALPAVVEPRSFYDLDYVLDLRNDPTSIANVEWWVFERFGGERNWAGNGSSAQGKHFFKQTEQLAKHKPKDAVQAITYSLMRMGQACTDGRGTKFCELAYCEGIAKAAVASMRKNK